MSVMGVHTAGGGHGVYATRVPGMAAAQSSQGEPAAVKDTETIDGLEGVMRARGMETAPGTQKRAQGPLVEADQGCDEGAH